MRIRLECGLEHLDVDLPNGSLVDVRREAVAVPLLDPAEAMRAALESPLGYPPLRRALTPDDHVTIVVDEGVPHLVELLVPLLEHIGQAQTLPSAITLLCPPSQSKQDWLEELPEQFQEVHCQVHSPADRKQMSYLATTKNGRRIYLNRTVVDADQVIVLSRRGYDTLLGYSGAEGSLFPALSDEATIEALNEHRSMAAPGAAPWASRKEASEATWLLGAPFFVQIIPGSGDEIVHVLAGPAESSAEGQRLLDARWRQTPATLADTVIATVSGNPTHQSFADLAAAAANASRVVQPDGRILLISGITPTHDPAIELLREADSPDQALARLDKRRLDAMAAAFQWAHAARRARIYLLSGLPAEAVEELFAVPLENREQVTRMLQGEGTVLVLNDAHKSMAVAEESSVPKMPHAG
jgi:nickel-dependent lactate racemase